MQRAVGIINISIYDEIHPPLIVMAAASPYLPCYLHHNGNLFTRQFNSQMKEVPVKYRLYNICLIPLNSPTTGWGLSPADRSGYGFSPGPRPLLLTFMQMSAHWLPPHWISVGTGNRLLFKLFWITPEDTRQDPPAAFVTSWLWWLSQTGASHS